MELLVTLRDTKNIEKLKNVCDGFIVGSLFTSSYHLSGKDLIEVNKFCKANNIKIYVAIDNFISEDDKIQVINYLDFINPDSLSIIKNAKVEASLVNSSKEDRYQFLRVGYFCADNKDSSPEHLVFNRAVSLKDGYKPAAN